MTYRDTSRQTDGPDMHRYKQTDRRTWHAETQADRQTDLTCKQKGRKTGPSDKDRCVMHAARQTESLAGADEG